VLGKNTLQKEKCGERDHEGGGQLRGGEAFIHGVNDHGES